MSQTVSLADYLFIRLKQLGVHSIHGVPGDYNLALLDYVVSNGLHWVGNCNELNAGYAADAYSRVKGLGALITTFGVGELSAVNAIAGAYAELAPVVHIVGTPTRKSQAERAKVHHTFNDGDFQRFALMHSHVTVAQASLTDPRTCPELIDSAIQQCLLHSRPVYIQLPADMVSVQVRADRLKSNIEVPASVPSNDEAAALTAIRDHIHAAKRPMILVDGESRAYGILGDLRKLIELSQWPTFVTVFGKSCVDEDLPNFRGIWKGNFASTEDKDFVKNSDLILCFGPHFSNTNSYSYTSVPDQSVSIMFRADTVSTADTTYRDLPAQHFLSTLLKQIDFSRTSKPSKPAVMNGEISSPTSSRQPSAPLTQDLFYKVFTQYLQPGDVILAETGTAGHGCRDFELPPHTFLFKPTTWLSIGYMLPATQGAGLAQRELHAAKQWPSPSGIPRTVLLIGDGSFQMTAQELSTIIREKLNVLLILINNDGYVIERCLHGFDQHYNDIANWNYLKAPSLFGASEKKGKGYYAETHRAATWAELEKVMSDDDITGPKLKMVEVIMGSEDAPEVLLGMLHRQKEAAGVK